MGHKPEKRQTVVRQRRFGRAISDGRAASEAPDLPASKQPLPKALRSGAPAHFLTQLLNAGESRFIQLIEKLIGLERNGQTLRDHLAKHCGKKALKDDYFWFLWGAVLIAEINAAPGVLDSLVKQFNCVGSLLHELDEFRRLEREVRDLLSQFSSTPIFFFDVQCKTWGALDSRQDENARLHMALSELQLLLQSGRLLRLRRCVNGNCGQWFVARSEKQNCCGTKCRKKVESTQPEAKKRHAEASRRYRERNPSRRVFVKGE